MKLTIVGGGTAGWMTAAFLRNNFSSFDITIIDKEVGTPIGVGEATLLDFSDFMIECGFDINEWLPTVGGTLKGGIVFPNWNKLGTEIWHPFLTNTLYAGNRTTHWDHWSHNQTEELLPLYELSKKNLIDPGQPDLYAYHVDCSKLVLYIQSKIKDSITVINSQVTEVKKDNSAITELILNNGESHSADIFIDCTGFLSLLKTQDRVDLEDRLFCNTAVVGQVDYEDKDAEQRPYAICTAVDHGWMWQIPVQHRMGSGLVFNRNITDPEVAKDYLHDFWQGRLPKDKIRTIDWTPYYIKNFWEANVVSIGLSGGFVEPLESTGISLIRIGIKKFAEKIKSNFFDDFDIAHYNATMIRHFEDVVDFVNMHYSYTERTGLFWEYVKSHHKKSDMQIHYENICSDESKLFYELTLPNIKDNRIFGPTNWITWLIQLGVPVAERIEINKTYASNFIELFNKNEEIRQKRSIPHQSMLDIVKLQGFTK